MAEEDIEHEIAAVNLACAKLIESRRKCYRCTFRTIHSVLAFRGAIIHQPIGHSDPIQGVSMCSHCRGLHEEGEEGVRIGLSQREDGSCHRQCARSKNGGGSVFYVCALVNGIEVTHILRVISGDH
jgi:hypothetical protein